MLSGQAFASKYHADPGTPVYALADPNQPVARSLHARVMSLMAFRHLCRYRCQLSAGEEISRFMTGIIDVRYVFHGVGQGLFGSGCLDLRLHWGCNFNWVYDCGTVSAQRHLDSALSDLEGRFSCPEGRRPYLDLVTVSHFDRDHVSGLEKLLERFDVGDLLLPYVPLWQRLVIAFRAHRAHRSRLTSFLVNPVDFITRLPNVSVNRILFVSASRSPEDLSRDADERPDPPRPIATDGWNEEGRDDNAISVVVETVDMDALNDADERKLDGKHMVGSVANRTTEVAFISEGASLIVNGCWEFLPYNDAQLAPMASPDFLSKVVRLRERLLGRVKADTERALQELKDSYAEQFDFADQQDNRNLISLFLYGGPIAANQERLWVLDKPYFPFEHRPILFRAGSVLYTGDGYLDTPQRFDSLHAFLGTERMRNLALLQVMHHGARDNWHAGLAAKIRPVFSVFSSNPNHRGYRHPHTEVFNDFTPYGPLQACIGSNVSVGLSLY